MPGTADSGPDSAVELGVKFKSDVRHHHWHPLLQGERQHRHARRQPVVEQRHAAGHGHLHVETASGWQQANFSTPVAITANTVYVASYHTNVGHYSRPELLRDQRVDNPPLHALQNGVIGATACTLMAPAALPEQRIPVLQLLGGRGIQFRPAPTLTFNRGDTGESAIASGRGDTAVHCHRHVLGQFNPEPHQPGDMVLLE